MKLKLILLLVLIKFLIMYYQLMIITKVRDLHMYLLELSR